MAPLLTRIPIRHLPIKTFESILRLRESFKYTALMAGAKQKLRVPNIGVIAVQNTSQSQLNRLLDSIDYTIIEELDRYSAEEEHNPAITLELELFRQGFSFSAASYRADALRRLPEEYLFEALSRLLFKRPLTEMRLLRIIKRHSRRPLTTLLLCSLLPGRRAVMIGLYTQAVRSVLSKSPWIFLLAKKIYYRCR